MNHIRFLGTSLLVLLFSHQTTSAAFYDIQYSWYHSSITHLEKAGIVSGFGDGNFGPEMLITRAEILKIVMGAAKIPLMNDISEPCFPDVKTSLWYSQYICTAYKLGIAK